MVPNAGLGAGVAISLVLYKRARAAVKESPTAIENARLCGPKAAPWFASVRAYGLRLGLDIARLAALRGVGHGLWHAFQRHLQNLIDPTQRLNIQ